MNKKQQEEQRRQEDQALKQGLLWVAGAVALEVLLFLISRYAYDYDATAQGVAIAEGLRAALNTTRILGGVLVLAGVALALIQGKKNTKAGWCVSMAVVGAVLLLCAHVSLTYQNSGLRMLYLLVPVLGGLAMSYYIYQRDFFLAALPGVAAVLGLWFVRVGGVGPEVLATVLVCVAVLIAVLKLKKGNGALNLGEKPLRILPEKVDYTVALISGVASVAVQAVAAVAGSALAYYLIFAMGAWLFALLVYHAVKML